MGFTWVLQFLHGDSPGSYMGLTWPLHWLLVCFSGFIGASRRYYPTSSGLPVQPNGNMYVATTPVAASDFQTAAVMPTVWRAGDALLC